MSDVAPAPAPVDDAPAAPAPDAVEAPAPTPVCFYPLLLFFSHPFIQEAPKEAVKAEVLIILTQPHSYLTLISLGNSRRCRCCTCRSRVIS
jgi:hypothetical protein